MPSCLLLTPCPAVVDAACVLWRGPCLPEPSAWWEALGIVAVAIPWSLLLWWSGLGRREEGR